MKKLAMFKTLSYSFVMKKVFHLFLFCFIADIYTYLFKHTCPSKIFDSFLFVFPICFTKCKIRGRWRPIVSGRFFNKYKFVYTFNNFYSNMFYKISFFLETAIIIISISLLRKCVRQI